MSVWQKDPCRVRGQPVSEPEVGVRLNSLALGSVAVALLPHPLQHLAGQPARQTAPVETPVLRGPALRGAGQLQPALARLGVWRGRRRRGRDTERERRKLVRVYKGGKHV